MGMEDLKTFLSLMFDPEDTVIVSDSKFSMHAVPLPMVFSGEVTLVPSSQNMQIKKVKSDQLIFAALNPTKGFRKDSNCYKLRNFLVEMDNYERNAQIQYIKETGLPYSGMVWSGSKSVHTLVSLEEDTLSEKEYRILYKWMLNIVALSDQALGNPSRSIRLPGAIRAETGNIQELIELKTRIKLEDFMVWLNRYPDLRPKVKEHKKHLTNGFDYEKLSLWATAQFKNGIDFTNGRNRAFFNLSCDLYSSGLTEDEAVEVLNQYFIEEHDFREKEFLKTISQAYSFMANKGK